MNQVFSFRRFWLLLKLDFAENGKSYLLSSGIIVGLMLLLMTPILFTKEYSDLLSMLHPLAWFISVIFGGSLFTSTAFAQYNTPTRGIAALMVPASRLEKFLATLLINMAFMVFFIVLFWQLHHRIIDLANSHLPAKRWRSYDPISASVITYFTYGYFLMQGAMLLGSIYFSKNTYIKALATCLVILLAAWLFNYIVADQFTSHPSYLEAFPFASWEGRGFENKRFIVEYPAWVWKSIWAFLIFLMVGLWSAAYTRLKEKEI